MSVYLADSEIDRLIAEDLPYGDLTTRALGLDNYPGRMTFTARHPLVVCGAGIAARIVEKLGGTVSFAISDGQSVPAGTELLQANGSANALHSAWKISQTLMEWTSGIATSTAKIREAAQAIAPHIRIACARKAPPGTRALAIMAVRAGGAEMHRTGLSETILIFPEHLTFMGPAAIAQAIATAKAQAPERCVVIEVTSEADALLAAHAGAHVVQLEKFTPESVRNVSQQIKGISLIAAAGGVKADNAALYAAAGADILVTSAPYSAPPAEVQVRISPAP